MKKILLVLFLASTVSGLPSTAIGKDPGVKTSVIVTKVFAGTVATVYAVVAGCYGTVGRDHEVDATVPPHLTLMAGLAFYVSAGCDLIHRCLP